MTATTIQKRVPTVLEIDFHVEEIAGLIRAAVREEVEKFAREFRSQIASEPLFYTEAGVAEKFGISEITITRMRRAGKIGYKRVGRGVVFTRTHIEEFLADKN